LEGEGAPSTIKSVYPLLEGSASVNERNKRRSRKVLKAIGAACLAIPLVAHAQSSPSAQTIDDQRALDERIREIVRQELDDRERQAHQERRQYEARRNAEAARQSQEAANSFINLVRRSTEAAWVRPPEANSPHAATVQVQLTESGDLWQATIESTSGDSAFDRSVLEAVEKAAPFPELRQLPPEQAADLRQFNLRFSPGDTR
jgi:colicin import membrane protein